MGLRLSGWSNATSGDASQQLAALPRQVDTLGGVLGGRDRGVVRLLRLGAPPEPAEQLGAGGVPRVVALERESVDLREGDLRPSSSAMATARSSATIGDGSSWVSWS